MLISTKQGKIVAKKRLLESDLLLNSDGSIYHLQLFPEEIAPVIILVGDPSRTAIVSKYFDRVVHQRQKREFVTHTGYIGKLYISVVSTGIGVGNIDVVMNEIDALHNINLKTREVNPVRRSLQFLRLGTCGALDSVIEPDRVVMSEAAIAFDGMLNFYDYEMQESEYSLYQQTLQHFAALPMIGNAYAATASQSLVNLTDKFIKLERSITLTCPGFYGSQGRLLRIPLIKANLLDLASTFTFNNNTIKNLEMETAAIYGLGRMLGHKCLSLSTVIANRVTQKASTNPHKAVINMIESALDIISSSQFSNVFKRSSSN